LPANQGRSNGERRRPQAQSGDHQGAADPAKGAKFYGLAGRKIKGTHPPLRSLQGDRQRRRTTIGVAVLEPDGASPRHRGISHLEAVDGSQSHARVAAADRRRPRSARREEGGARRGSAGREAAEDTTRTTTKRRSPSRSTSDRWRSGRKRSVPTIPMSRLRSTAWLRFTRANVAMPTPSRCSNERWRSMRKRSVPTIPMSRTRSATWLRSMPNKVATPMRYRWCRPRSSMAARCRPPPFRSFL
jgi:hypothetical protein